MGTYFLEGNPLLWVLNRSKGCTELNAKQAKRMVEEREIKISPKNAKTGKWKFISPFKNSKTGRLLAHRENGKPNMKEIRKTKSLLTCIFQSGNCIHCFIERER